MENSTKKSTIYMMVIEDGYTGNTIHQRIWIPKSVDKWGFAKRHVRTTWGKGYYLCDLYVFESLEDD